MTTCSISLAVAAHEMAREEILKQIAFVSREIRNARFTAEGRTLECEVPEGELERLRPQIQAVGLRIERALRSLHRKVVYASPAMERPSFAPQKTWPGVHYLGTGQVALSGIPLRLFRYFDRVFEAFGDPWRVEAVRTPTLIPSAVLARCDYFRSFPQNVTFAAHLREDTSLIDAFRTRHQHLDDLDDLALADMARPEACLSPAVCYHLYHMLQNTTVPEAGFAYGICGKCFRYESSNISDLRRLWDFTMREVVFVGSRDKVLQHRERSIGMMSEFLAAHELAGEIRTASDPFFVAPDAVSKTFFQLSSDSKFEVSLLLPEGDRVAVGSHNYHSDFFGRVFSTDVEGQGPMHSVCVAFGLERWVHAFLQQHGDDPDKWPDPVRNSAEFALA